MFPPSPWLWHSSPPTCDLWPPEPKLQWFYKPDYRLWIKLYWPVVLSVSLLIKPKCYSRDIEGEKTVFKIKDIYNVKRILIRCLNCSIHPKKIFSLIYILGIITVFYKSLTRPWTRTLIWSDDVHVSRGGETKKTYIFHIDWDLSFTFERRAAAAPWLSKKFFILQVTRNRNETEVNIDSVRCSTDASGPSFLLHSSSWRLHYPQCNSTGNWSRLT